MASFWKSVKCSSGSRTAPPPSPLDDPKILERVLKHLCCSQLRYGPLYVSKSWHAASLQLLTDTTTWSFDVILSDVMAGSLTAGRTPFEQRLLTANCLKVHFKKGATIENSRVKAILKETIENFPTETRQRIQTLQYLEEGRYGEIFPEGALFSSIQHITRLHVMTHATYCHIWDRLFIDFPNLEEVFIGQDTKNSSRPDQRGRMKRNDWNRPWPASVSKLRSLTLQSLSMEVHNLNSLLTNCPKLKELRLVTIRFHDIPKVPSHQEQRRIMELREEPREQPVTYYQEYFTDFAERCPELESFHFTEARFPSSTNALIAMQIVFPRLSRWSISADALVFQPDRLGDLLGSTLEGFMAQLTTLELLPMQETESAVIPKLLYLAPNLLHLKAKGVFMETSDIGHSNNSPTQQRLWACRQLRTFHIGIKASMYAAATDRGPCQSRLFFAYLVKCCPRLQDIFIHSSDLNLTLEGGLCLLSKLTELRCLDIHGMGSLNQDRDFDWMSTLNPRGQSIRERMRRRGITESLKVSKQDKRAALEQQQLFNTSSKNSVNPAENELRKAIWEASALTNMPNLLRRIWTLQTRGIYCWPHLESHHISTENISFWEPALRPALLYQQKVCKTQTIIDNVDL
ncbi:hypothetical protein B0O80DRAFT_500495 [Mortierella sp. GBAus27b]|nr:hypothetical protein BGX31_003868 [Mortierella sp. GBA43]KAI8350691.1 hypothetical protein B0O80DRAFT_500495 [Mortierella sp. GBAus27b]